MLPLSRGFLPVCLEVSKGSSRDVQIESSVDRYRALWQDVNAGTHRRRYREAGVIDS